MADIERDAVARAVGASVETLRGLGIARSPRGDGPRREVHAERLRGTSSGRIAAIGGSQGTVAATG
jgi:hypothetical protein